MTRIFVPALLLCAAVAAFAQNASEPPAATPETKRERALATQLYTYSGDLDGLLELRAIRVLVPYSRTLFFHDRGQALGASAQAAHELERLLNKKHPGKPPFTVALIPTTRDKLLESLVNG